MRLKPVCAVPSKLGKTKLKKQVLMVVGKTQGVKKKLVLFLGPFIKDNRFYY